MTFEPESIKDLICMAVLRLGQGATRQAIGRERICSDAVMQIALDSMLSGGHLVPDPEGITFQLSDALRAEYPAAGFFVTEKALPALARAFKFQAVEEQTTHSGGDHMAATKQCRTCEDEFDLDEDHFHRAPRSADGFSHDCHTCLAKRRKKNGKAKAKPPELDESLHGDVIVIPPRLELRCAVVVSGKDSSGRVLCTLRLQQGDNFIDLDDRQLDDIEAHVRFAAARWSESGS